MASCGMLFLTLMLMSVAHGVVVHHRHSTLVRLRVVLALSLYMHE